MAEREFDLGWYYIDTTWSLFIDGNHQKVHVDYIEVDEHPNDQHDGYHVSHYDRAGNLLTALSLDAGDLNPELRDRETTDRPMHL